MKEIYFFLKRFFSTPSAVGSLVPSSEKLALAITAPSRSCHTATRYLEVGGGSGALTQHLVKNMQGEDRLDIVENDPKFCIILRRKFAHLPNVAIHEISILDFDGPHYDVVISSLPLNAFRAHMVKEIFQKYESLVKKGGSLSYFEYLGLQKIKRALLFGEISTDFKDTLTLKRQFELKYGTGCDKIWWNLPPARVIHCQL